MKVIAMAEVYLYELSLRRVMDAARFFSLVGLSLFLFYMWLTFFWCHRLVYVMITNCQLQSCGTYLILANIVMWTQRERERECVCVCVCVCVHWLTPQYLIIEITSPQSWRTGQLTLWRSLVPLNATGIPIVQGMHCTTSLGRPTSHFLKRCYYVP